jgi:hypothetical protein
MMRAHQRQTQAPNRRLWLAAFWRGSPFSGCLGARGRSHSRRCSLGAMGACRRMSSTPTAAVRGSSPPGRSMPPPNNLGKFRGRACCPSHRRRAHHGRAHAVQRARADGCGHVRCCADALQRAHRLRQHSRSSGRGGRLATPARPHSFLTQVPSRRSIRLQHPDIDHACTKHASAAFVNSRPRRHRPTPTWASLPVPLPGPSTVDASFMEAAGPRSKIRCRRRVGRRAAGHDFMFLARPDIGLHPAEINTRHGVDSWGGAPMSGFQRRLVDMADEEHPGHLTP